MPGSLPSGSPPRTQAVSEAPASRVVPKPIPKTQTADPRGYQISQLRRRYSPKETTQPDGATSLAFKLAPSDPDFPFDLDALECDLRVPGSYPEEKPTLRVASSGMPRGFAINIERGWDALVKERPGATLLALTNLLDKNLETILAGESAETVKLVAFKDTRHLEQGPPAPKQPLVEKQPPAEKPKPKKPTYVREPSFTKEEITSAKARRAQETRQLEARMGRMPAYRKSPDGIVYTLPLEPKSRAQLPPGLQGVKTVHLVVPLLYPLQQLRVQLNEADGADAEPVEDLFALKAAEQKRMNLTSHLNYLAVNMHVLAKMAAFQARCEEKEEEERQRKQEAAEEEKKGEGEAEGSVSGVEAEEFVKSHVKVIPRPPEWDYDQDSDTDSDGSLEGEYDSYEYTDNEHSGGEPEPQPSNQVVEKGTAIHFPNIELHGVELLQLTALNLSVKCSRCKTFHEITNLRGGAEKTDSCGKCASSFAASFTPQPVHSHSNRAGLVDVGGCTIADMLPSTFTPTCGNCSTPSPSLVAVRGDAPSTVCRECHSRFNFKIPEIKFLHVSPGTLIPSNIGNKKKRERLGITAGEPLPSNGTCSHYRKSNRWFRFSCCGRVHACDRCHDEAEGHMHEWAGRMICGFCSREQRYAAEACGFCGRSVVGKRGRGFWEGGRGTRDRRFMSKKDGRKFKRVGGSEAAAKAKEREKAKEKAREKEKEKEKEKAKA